MDGLRVPVSDMLTRRRDLSGVLSSTCSLLNTGPLDQQVRQSVCIAELDSERD